MDRMHAFVHSGSSTFFSVNPLCNLAAFIHEVDERHILSCFFVIFDVYLPDSIQRASQAFVPEKCSFSEFPLPPSLTPQLKLLFYCQLIGAELFSS